MPHPHADRFALAAIAMQFFINGALAASFIARAPQIRDRIGVSVDEYGVLLTLGAAAGLAGSALAGRLIERFTSRDVLRGGALLLLLSLPVIGFAKSPVVWAVAIAVFFLADALVDIAMNLQGSRLSARRAVPVMNRLHGVWSLGTVAGGLGAMSANAAGVDLPIHLLGVAAFLALAQVFVNRHVLDRDDTTGPVSNDDLTALASTATTPENHSTFDADASRVSKSQRDVEPARPVSTGVGFFGARVRIALVVLAAACAVIAEVGAADWATFRLTDDFDRSAALGSLAFVAVTLGMTAMRLGGDTLVAWMGDRRLHHLSILTTSAGLTIATLIPDPLVAIAGFLLAGMGTATFMPKLYDDAARLPGRPGAGLGAMTAGVRIAFLVTPLGIGWLAGTAVSVGQAIAIVALPAMAGLALISAVNDHLTRGAH